MQQQQKNGLAVENRSPAINLDVEQRFYATKVRTRGYVSTQSCCAINAMRLLHRKKPDLIMIYT
jgi:hypothetical protein